MSNLASASTDPSSGESVFPPAPVPAEPSRRHDLDALRAIAMLLGIVLHAMLSMVPGVSAVWPVQDNEQSAVLGWTMAAIHGFRMPLFFLISGFFTAMLWRKRGLKSLLGHRFRRIFLPLLLGMFTIVPAVWIVSIGAALLVPPPAVPATEKTSDPSPPGGSDLWETIRTNDLEQLKKLVVAKVDLSGQDPKIGATPLTMAALYGSPEMVDFLLASGVDVRQKNQDGGTPLHAAAFLGRADICQRLMDAGADTDAKNGRGEIPLDSANADWLTTMFIAGLLEVEVDRSQVEAGRREVREQLARTGRSPQAVGDVGELPIEDSREQGLAQLAEGVMFLLFLFPAFHHLWFLYFLCWLVAGFAVYAAISDRFSKGARSRSTSSGTSDVSPGWFRRIFFLSPMRWLWLIPLTMLPQAAMGLTTPTFGPDTSSGLLPIPQVLLYYAIFFGFGALYFDCQDDTGRIGRGWWLMLPLALLVVFPVGYEFTKHEFGFGDALAPESAQRALAVFFQVLYAWLMTFGLMGLFQRCFRRESQAMRYTSDSSYWLYVAHLPLIIVLQGVICRWPLPWSVKLLLLTSVATVLLLFTYATLVRYTWLGRLLNGPRTRPGNVSQRADLQTESS